MLYPLLWLALQYTPQSPGIGSATQRQLNGSTSELPSNFRVISPESLQLFRSGTVEDISGGSHPHSPAIQCGSSNMAGLPADWPVLSWDGMGHFPSQNCNSITNWCICEEGMK